MDPSPQSVTYELVHDESAEESEKKPNVTIEENEEPLDGHSDLSNALEPSEQPADEQPADEHQDGEHQADAQQSQEPEAADVCRPSLSTPRGLLRTLRLEALYTPVANLIGWPQLVEEPRPAFYRDRKWAVYHCILHLVPVVGAILLIYINVRESFIGYTLVFFDAGVNDQLAALQFVAKAHELLMLGSLSEVVFRAVRWRLALGGGLPFGAVFAGLNFGFLNTLWSMEFWAVISNMFSANASPRMRTARLMALVTIACLLGATVGPSSANLMIPRWRDWPAGGTAYHVNATNEELFPAEIKVTPNLEHCRYRFDDPSCPYGGYSIISQSFMSAWANMLSLDNTPETIYLPSRQAELAMTFRDRSISQKNSSGMVWANAFSLATANAAAIADGLSLVGFLWAYSVKHAAASVKRQWSKRDNAVYSVNTRQPIVMVYCNQYSPTTQPGDTLGDFADLRSGGVNGTYDGDHDTLHYDNVPAHNRTTQSWAQKTIKESRIPGILWLDDESLRESTASTLNAIAVLPESTLGYPTYYACSVDSRYAPVTLTTATHSPKIISGYALGMKNFGTYDPAWDKVYPSPEWASLVNVDLPPSENVSSQASSPFAELIRSSGLWSNENAASGTLATYIVESALASLLANGMARLSYNVSMAGALKSQWEDELLPERQMGWGGDAYNLTPMQQRSSTNLTMHATASGYGYSYRGTAQMVAIVVLFTYILLACGTILDAILTGKYSASWDTAAGIAALTANSASPEFLQNTGTGIRSLATFAVPVEVVNIDGHAELRSVLEKAGQGIEVDTPYE